MTRLRSRFPCSRVHTVCYVQRLWWTLEVGIYTNNLQIAVPYLCKDPAGPVFCRVHLHRVDCCGTWLQNVRFTFGGLEIKRNVRAVLRLPRNVTFGHTTNVSQRGLYFGDVPSQPIRLVDKQEDIQAGRHSSSATLLGISLQELC